MATINALKDDRSINALIDRVEAGETVEIARGGKVVAKVVPVAKRPWTIDFDELKQLREQGKTSRAEREPIDWDAIDRVRESMPRSGWTVEEMRRHDML